MISPRAESQWLGSHPRALLQIYENLNNQATDSIYSALTMKMLGMFDRRAGIKAGASGYIPWPDNA